MDSSQFGITNFNSFKEIVKNQITNNNYNVELAKFFKLRKNDFEILIQKENACGIEELKKTRIITLLGVMTLEEILDSEFNHIHYIGFSYKEEWADGRLDTPLEFCHHDIIHAENFNNFFEDKVNFNILKNFY